jgi:hypothetical protein
MKSREVHGQTKIKLSQNTNKVCSMVWQQGVETVAECRKVLNAFERRALRKIYGPVLVNGQWQNMYYQNIYKLYKEIEPTRNIRLRRLQWVGQVMRLKDERVPKKALKGYTEGRRQVGRTRGKWFDSVDRDTERISKCSTGGQQKIEMPTGGE